MTCIVGLIEDGTIYLGGDSASTSGWDLRVRSEPKVFHKGPMVMGVTGYARLSQLLQYALKLPEHPEGMDTLAYMCTLFVNAVRDCLKEHGYAQKQNEQERQDSMVLIGYRQRLFILETNYQILESIQPYNAVGCGESFALGALYALDYQRFDTFGEYIDPEERVRAALEASETFSAGVRGPYHIIQLTDDSTPMVTLEELAHQIDELNRTMGTPTEPDAERIEANIAVVSGTEEERVVDAEAAS